MTRKLLSFVLACTVAMATMPLLACNQQQVLNDLKRFAPVVTDLLVVTCEFTASPLCATGGVVLTTAEQHLFKVWQDYLTAKQNNAVTAAIWNDLNAALQTLITDSSDVFALAHLVNGQHQKDVLDMATASEGLLAVIESFLPAPPVGVMLARRAGPRLATFLPAPNLKTGTYDGAWLKSWENNYNSLPAVKAHKMQLHRGFWSSLGNAIGEAKFGGN